MIKDLDLKGELYHYTMSDNLPLILKNNLTLLAPCINSFWGEEERIINDNQEFRNALELVGLLKEELRHEEQNKDNYLMNTLKNEGYIDIIGSTQTPYIICFSEEKSSKLYNRFYNKGKGLPISLVLDTSNISCLDIRICDREELIRVHYTHAQDSYDKDELKDIHAEVKKHLDELLDKATEIKDNTKIDACLYIKRGRYQVEAEVRYIYRKIEDFAFAIDKTGFKYIFNTEQSNESEDGNSKKTKKQELLEFSPDCLKGIVFGPSVTKAEAVKVLSGPIKDNNNNQQPKNNTEEEKTIKEVIKENYPHIYVRLFDNTEIDLSEV